jgi:hypothetical protein
MQKQELAVPDWQFDLQGMVALKSRAIEWASKGNGLFQNEHYEAAAVCFARAYLEEPQELAFKWKEQQATACHLAKLAATEPNPSLRAHYLLSAGYLFLQSKNGDQAATCLLQASKKGAQLAARVLLKHQRMVEASTALQAIGSSDRQHVLEITIAEHPEMRQLMLKAGLQLQ